MCNLCYMCLQRLFNCVAVRSLPSLYAAGNSSPIVGRDSLDYGPQSKDQLIYQLFNNGTTTISDTTRFMSFTLHTMLLVIFANRHTQYDICL